jgi:hypothetical protein
MYEASSKVSSTMVFVPDIFGSKAEHISSEHGAERKT